MFRRAQTALTGILLVLGLVSTTQGVRVVRYDRTVGVGYNKVRIKKYL